MRLNNGISFANGEFVSCNQQSTLVLLNHEQSLLNLKTAIIGMMEVLEYVGHVTQNVSTRDF